MQFVKRQKRIQTKRTERPYDVFFHVYKPVTKFKKTEPPEPDFRIGVIEYALYGFVSGAMLIMLVAPNMSLFQTSSTLSVSSASFQRSRLLSDSAIRRLWLSKLQAAP